MRLFYLLLSVWMLVFLNEPAFAKHKAKSHAHATHHAATGAATATMTALPATYNSAQLADQLNYLVNTNDANADIAVFVKSMKDGETLYTRNINQPMTPASTMKILTAEAALIYLGPDYRFSTQLLTDAKSVKNGVLQGNLYIVLSGDPSLTYDDLAELLVTLKSQQIQSIAGNVYIDNTAYDQSFYGPGWVWKDRNYCYAAPISAGIINHNCIPFTVSSSKVAGRTAQVTTSSKYYLPAIRNSVVTATHPRGCSVRLSTDPGSVITIDGCISRGNSWGVSYVVTDVPEYDRSLVKSLLGRVGVGVYGNITFGSAPDNLSLVGQHASKPLRDLIVMMLKKSDNVIAGALFKKLGQLYSRQPGSWENGSLAVSQILSKKANVNINGMRVLDGSGLSPDNLVTPAQMMQVLNFAFHHPPTSYEFISALPIAGVDGTLKGRMGNIARRVRAKTGTISGVISLAGYVASANKEPLAFVIMINGQKGMAWRYRTMEDKIATVLARYQGS